MSGALTLEPLLHVKVEALEPLSAGAVPGGEVRVVPFAAGEFEGRGALDLRGKLLPGGTDWQRVRSDGVVEIRAHYLLESDRGERIEVISEGMRHAPPGVLERIARGEPVPADAYYFRTAIRFFTAAPRLDALNRVLAISVGIRTQHGVELEIYGVP
ncbi:MAG: DUF3237 domain-containing protein [Polyangiales bacterium]